MHGFHDPRVDAEHDRIITSFEALWGRRAQGPADPEGTARLAACLLQYLRRHCRHEEALMRARGYPELAAHARAHRDLQREFRSRLHRLAADPANVAAGLAAIRARILGHLVTWDEAYGAWLEQHLPGAA